MKVYRLSGEVTISVYTEIESDSLEEAKENLCRFDGSKPIEKVVG